MGLSGLYFKPTKLLFGGLYVAIHHDFSFGEGLNEGNIYNRNNNPKFPMVAKFIAILLP